jgi:hypothetical protein
VAALLVVLAAPAAGAVSGRLLDLPGMTSFHWAAGTARLPDGDVLVAGGYTASFNGNADGTTNTDLFLWPEGRFISGPPMLQPRAGQAAVTMNDGRVLEAGGSEGQYSLSASSEFYDPKVRAFTPGPALSTPRSGAAAIRLPDSRVLIAGGYDGAGPTTSAELLDPAGTAFTPTGSMAEPRSGAAAALLPDGEAILIGGIEGSYSGSTTTEIFNPSRNTFRPGPNLPGQLGGPAASLGGSLIVIGPEPAAQILDLSDFSLTVAGSGQLSPPIFSDSAAPLGPGRALYAGGQKSAGDGHIAYPVDQAWVFSLPASFKVRRHGPKLLVGVDAPGTVTLRAPRVVKSRRREGGPGTIKVPLVLTARSRKTLDARGKLRIRIRVKFVPHVGASGTLRKHLVLTSGF